MWREGGYRGISGSCGSPNVPKFGGRGDADGRIQLLGASQTEPLQRCFIQAWGAGKFLLGAKSPFFWRQSEPQIQSSGESSQPRGERRGSLCPRSQSQSQSRSPPGRAPLLRGQSRLGDTEGAGELRALPPPRVSPRPAPHPAWLGLGGSVGVGAQLPAPVLGRSGLQEAGGDGGLAVVLPPRRGVDPGGSWRRWIPVIRRCRAAVAAGATSSVVPGTRRSQSRR